MLILKHAPRLGLQITELVGGEIQHHTTKALNAQRGGIITHVTQLPHAMEILLRQGLVLGPMMAYAALAPLLH